MVIHLSIWAFKKGTQTRENWESAIAPQLQNTFLGSMYHRLYFTKLSFLGMFNPKYRLIKKEFKKPYTELFSEELIDKMTRKQYIEDVYAEVNKIALMKERIEYKKFDFNDSINISRRLQFFEIKESIRKGAERNVLRIVHKMNDNNMLIPAQRETGRTILKRENLIDNNEQDTGLNLVNQHEMEQGNYNVEPFDETVKPAENEEVVGNVSQPIITGERKRF